MIKLSFFFIVFFQCAFSQKSNKNLINELFIAPNKSIVGDYFINGYGRMAFDCGVRHNFNRLNKNSFIFGLELNFSRFYMYNHQFLGHTGSYKNADLNYIYLSNNFIIKNKIGKRQKLFIESGLFFDVLLNSHINATYLPYNSLPYKINENFYGANFLGISTSLGYHFELKKIQFAIKPEFKLKLIQIQSDNYIRDLASVRLCIIFNKNYTNKISNE